MSKHKGTTRAGARRWPSKVLLKTVYEVAGLASTRDKGYGPKWTVVTSLLVSIFRDEKAKKQSIDTFNATQEAKAKGEETGPSIRIRGSKE